MMRLENICEVIDGIEHNISEARGKIKRAWEMRGICKPMADWQRDMAAGHLAYNTAGGKLAGELITQARGEYAGNERALGMIDAWEKWMHEAMSEMAEVRAMIDMYK